MDRIDLFRIFCRVVDCANFTKAADSLQMPRSSVSGAIQKLEQHVGTRLLHRATRSVSATQDGFAFYERCQRLISDMEETEALFKHDTSNPKGHLRVDVPSRIGRLVLAPALPGFLTSYPGIDIDLGMTDRAVNLIADRVDCVLRVGPLTDSSMIARKIGDLPIINVASPAYLAQHGTPTRPADLSAHVAVNYASPTTGRVEDWEWVEAGRLCSLPMRSRVTVTSAEALIACCLAGLGMIQIPKDDITTHLDAGELVQVMPGHQAAALPMHLLYPHRQHLSRRLQVFIEWMVPLMRQYIEDA